MLDDASIVFLTLCLREVFLIPDKSDRIELNAHELISKITQSLSINFVYHSLEFEEVFTLWLQIWR